MGQTTTLPTVCEETDREQLLASAPPDLRDDLAYVLDAEAKGEEEAPALREAYEASLAEYRAKTAPPDPARPAVDGKDSEHTGAMKAKREEILALARRGRDFNTRVALAIGRRVQEAKELNFAAHPGQDWQGPKGLIALTHAFLLDEIRTQAPWLAKGGHISEYAKVWAMFGMAQDAAPNMDRIAFDSLRVVAQAMYHNQRDDTYGFKSQVAYGDPDAPKYADCAYARWAIDTLNALASSPRTAKAVRDDLRKLESDAIAAAQTPDELAAAQTIAEREAQAAKVKEKTDFVNSLPVTLAKLGATNEEVEKALLAAGVIPPRLSINATGDTVASADPHEMTVAELAEFAEALKRTHNRAKIAAVFKPLAAYVAASEGKKARGATHHSNDAPTAPHPTGAVIPEPAAAAA